MSDTWTIGELAEHAARALRAGAAPANGRVRDVPGERLIRWYTTIGLVDPPLTRRGRIAQYGRRHLLQLLAIKRLQAAGHSIAEIQAALAGATDRMLEDTASAARAMGLEDADGSVRDEAGRERFWTERPDGDGVHRAAEAPPYAAAPGQGSAGAVMPGSGADAVMPGSGADLALPHGRVGVEAAGNPDVERQSSRRTRPGMSGWRTGERADVAGRRTGAEGRGGAGAVVAGVRLGDGVRLVLDGGRALSEEDVQAVLAAAGPLLAVLEERELI
ncbi:helix-turn-helix domain-containing protein [Nonomuraea sp. 10N515B]|uniref:helix-turn-helix domain-containing protein n=1 Tax=Nonomuraea sp. 10N515B TaxID=3457422 RepID=UPI003FCD7E4A